MRVFVSGSEGYIGSALMHVLRREKGFELLGFDSARSENEDITRDDVVGFVRDWEPDAIVNLAGISGEHAAKHQQHEAFLVNGQAPACLRTATAGDLFIQASTCSLYDKAWVDSTYARSKEAAERELLRTPYNLVLPRFGTLMGFNPNGKMRWDLPLHRMVYDAVDTGQVSVPEKDLWRPWLLLCDLVDVIYRWLLAYKNGCRFREAYPMPLVTFNSGLHELAAWVSHATGAKIKKDPEHNDPRSYSAPQTTGGHQAGRHIELVLDQIMEKAYERSLGAAAQSSKADG